MWVSNFKIKRKREQVTLVPDFINDGVNVDEASPWIGNDVMVRPGSWAFIGWEDCYEVCDTDYNDLATTVQISSPINGLVTITSIQVPGLSAYTPWNVSMTPNLQLLSSGQPVTFQAPWQGTEYALQWYMLNQPQSLFLKTGTQNAWVYQSDPQVPTPEPATFSLMLGVTLIAVSCWIKKKFRLTHSSK